MLFRLEHENNNEIVKTESLQIEHIMPQTLNEEWKQSLGSDYKEINEKYLHTIGNLTLTGHNQQIGNIIFAEKKKKYEKSHLKITRAICEYESWIPESIEKRAKNLIEESIQIWKCPKEPDITPTEETDDDFEDEYLEDEYLEGTDIPELWYELKEKILSSFKHIEFHMTKQYGSFTIVTKNKKIGFCGIIARKNKIYLPYHTRIKDKILEPSTFVEDVSNVGRSYNMGDLRSTILTEDDVDSVINNLKRLYHSKCE